MSSPKVTLNELIEKWKTSTNGQVKVMHDEMTAFMSEAFEGDITSQEIMRSKNRIIQVWVALSWKEAQDRSEKMIVDKNGVPHSHKWKNKDWWQDRLTIAQNIFNKVYLDFYSSNKAPVRQSPVEKQEDITKDWPVITTLEEFRALKAQRMAAMGED